MQPSRALVRLPRSLGSSRLAAMSVAVKEPVGKYRYLLELGQGGTANVYLAVAQGPSGFNKLVVMKTLKPSLVIDAEFVNMFRTEARLAARLSHPNIVQTNEVTEDGSAPSIVMEYLEGQPLSSILARSLGNMPLELHLKVLMEVLAGLEYAHELLDYDGTPLRLVHRDVTPHNVFVTFDGQVKLLDFGIAKTANGSPDTQTGVIKGKARYIPPEQIAGTPIDRRADLFAVGVMLWEALAGERMWKGQSDVTVMNRVLTGNIPSPSIMRPAINPALDQICRKALSSNRDQRYGTAAEFETALEAPLRAMTGGGLPSNRELGKHVSDLFADIRFEVRRAIDQQLRVISSLSSDEYHVRALNPPAMALPVRSLDTLSGAQPMATITSTARGTSLGTSKRRWQWGLCVAGLVGVLLLIWRIAVHGGTPTTSTANTRASAAARPASTLPSTPEAREISGAREMFTLRIETSPASAQLYLDGNALSTNPYHDSLPQGKYLVRAEAEGYLATSEAVFLERDAELKLALVPLETRFESVPIKQPKRGRGAPALTGKAKAARVSTASVAQVNCGVPYFVDERGIKKIKPECM